jgi:hypothetical protein
MKDPDDCPADQHRHSEQGVDPELVKDRIKHIGVIDPLNDYWLLVHRDATGEKTLPHRDTNTLTDRGFDPLGNSHHKLLGGGIQQQHRSCVDSEELPHPIKQLTQ